MKKIAKRKSEDVATVMGEMVQFFGKRFDELEQKLATKEQMLALQTQVNSIETQLKGMQYGKMQVRVADLEEEVFGKVRG